MNRNKMHKSLQFADVKIIIILFIRIYVAKLDADTSVFLVSLLNPVFCVHMPSSAGLSINCQPLGFYLIWDTEGQKRFIQTR